MYFTLLHFYTITPSINIQRTEESNIFNQSKWNNEPFSMLIIIFYSFISFVIYILRTNKVFIYTR